MQMQVLLKYVTGIADFLSKFFHSASTALTLQGEDYSRVKINSSWHEYIKIDFLDLPIIMG